MEIIAFVPRRAAFEDSQNGKARVPNLSWAVSWQMLPSSYPTKVHRRSLQ